MSMIEAKKKADLALKLKQMPCIYYPLHLKKDQAKTLTLIN